MGPFDDLTEVQRQQIREAHAANKEREMRAGFWTAGGWMPLEDAPPDSDESPLPRLACTECDWHGNGDPGVKCPPCGSGTCPCQCAEVEEIGRTAERAAREILAADDIACGQADETGEDAQR